jgi:hypothetical protein
MTSRERMSSFYAGRPVDRIPNGLGECETAGMHLLAYDNLKRVLGVNDPTNRMYTFMTNSVFEPSVLPTWSIEQTTEADNDLRPRGVGNFSRFPAGAIHGSSMR